MIYLLDVNALLALGYTHHVHHVRVFNWLARQRELHAPSAVKLATCATTELGFIRVASGSTRLAKSVAQARTDLRVLKLQQQMLFMSDRMPGVELPVWIAKSADTTDGHLMMLARANGARLATLDHYIRGAEFIPATDADIEVPPNLAMHCRCSV